MSTAKAGGCCGGASAGGGCCKDKSTEKKAGGCGGGCACAGKDGVKAVGGGCCKEKAEWDGQMTDELKEHLKSLINTASMTCFIKGSPAEPRCKFSKQLLRFLMDNNVTKIAYHDIMEDTLVRESLKVYSNWKTFPQIYVEGKLIGGIDAVRELHAKGEFLPKVPKECFGKGLYPRIRKIIDQAHVMLFMQGTPSEPKTDEDKQAVNLLKQTGAEFGHFDVTSAEDIAKGTPAYARFTGGYPQLFIGGEYAGGLAFITEKASQGKLADALKKPVPAATTSTATVTPTAEATKA